MRIGITGQSGFLGTNLYHYLGTCPGIVRVPFVDDFFHSSEALQRFVVQCDAIVHLAAICRHADSQYVYDVNTVLVRQLVDAMEAASCSPHVLFASSIQEKDETAYARSKVDGRRLLAEWASRNHALFTGLIMPNIFGPFARPNYASVVATFCHKFLHGETPQVLEDRRMSLLYVEDFCQFVTHFVEDRVSSAEMRLPHRFEKRVSEIFELVHKFTRQYVPQGRLPVIADEFERDMFNTYVSYVDTPAFFPRSSSVDCTNEGKEVNLLVANQPHITSFSITSARQSRTVPAVGPRFQRLVSVHGNAVVEQVRVLDGHAVSIPVSAEKNEFLDLPAWTQCRIFNPNATDFIAAHLHFT